MGQSQGPYRLEFNHLIIHWDHGGMYIPQDFEQVIERQGRELGLHPPSAVRV